MAGETPKPSSDASGTSGGAGPSTTGPASLADLQRTTAEISRMVLELRETQGSIRSLTLLGSVITVVMLLGFAGFTYLRVRENLTSDKLQAAGLQEGKLLLGTVQEQLQTTLVHDVLPYYTKMGSERFKAATPKLEAQLKQQVDKLPTDLQDGIGKQIDARFQAIATRAQSKLSKEFPAVAADGGQRAGERVKTALIAEGARLQEHVKGLAADERQKIAVVLAKFPLSDAGGPDQDRLMRQLVHNMIMLADYELLSGDPTATTAKTADASH